MSAKWHSAGRDGRSTHCPWLTGAPYMALIDTLLAAVGADARDRDRPREECTPAVAPATCSKLGAAPALSMTCDFLRVDRVRRQPAVPLDTFHARRRDRLAFRCDRPQLHTACARELHADLVDRDAISFTDTNPRAAPYPPDLLQRMSRRSPCSRATTSAQFTRLQRHRADDRRGASFGICRRVGQSLDACIAGGC